MQSEILEANPQADLRVYTVWLEMLAGDRRSAWDPDLMPDPRVEHYWDADWAAGRWFAEKVLGFEGIAWDVYFLYGPEADWADAPAPLISSGFTVIGKSDQLFNDITPLLAGSG